MHNRLHRLQSRLDLFPLPIRWVFWTGLLIRLLLMPWIGHNDTVFIPWLSFPITLGHFNIYEFWKPIFDAAPDVMRRVIWLSNPPFSYFTIAGWMSLLRLTGLVDSTGWTFSGAISIWDLQLIPRMLFLTKSLYLVLDVGSWLIMRRMVNFQYRTRFDVLWMFSPVLLVGLYVMGQTDIFPVFFLSWGLYAIWRNSQSEKPRYWLNLLAVFLLGIGGGYKMWPLFLLPFWAVLLDRRFFRQLGLLCAGLVPIGIAFLIFLPSPTFRSWVVLNGFSTRFLDESLGAAGWQNLSPYLVFYFALLIAVYYFQKYRNYTFQDKVIVSAGVLAGFFILTHNWEFYWLVWLTPFLTLLMAEMPNPVLPFYGISFYFLFYTFSGWNMGGELFIPLARIFLELYKSPHLREVIFPNSDLLLRRLSVVAFSLFVVILAGVLIWSLIKNRMPKDNLLPNTPIWPYLLPTTGSFIYLAAIFTNTLIQTNTTINQILASINLGADPVFAAIYVLLILSCIFIPTFVRRPAA